MGGELENAPRWPILSGGRPNGAKPEKHLEIILPPASGAEQPILPLRRRPTFAVQTSLCTIQAQFLKDMLKGVNPSVAVGRDTKMVREILDKTAERLGKDLAGQPAVEADLRSTIGEIYHEIGRYSESEAMQRRALALRRLVLGNEHPDVAVSLRDLGVALYAEGRWAESEIAHREALQLRIRLFGNEHPDVAESLDCVGFVLCTRGKLVEAETLHRKALAMRQKLLGNDSLEVASSLNNLANVLRSEGKLSEAEAMYREVLATARRLRGDDDLRLQGVIRNLARVLARIFHS
jgi:eukaryotic-like serine/threonine-protein kinase